MYTKRHSLLKREVRGVFVLTVLSTAEMSSGYVHEIYWSVCRNTLTRETGRTGRKRVPLSTTNPEFTAKTQ